MCFVTFRSLPWRLFIVVLVNCRSILGLLACMRYIPEGSSLIPEAFIYSFLAHFATRIASFIFFIGTNRWKPRKESLWSRPLASSFSCHQLLTVVSDWRIFLIALRVIWLVWLNIFGDVIGQKKMTSLTTVKCWASMKVKFSTIVTKRLSFLPAQRFDQRFESKISK